MYRSGLSQARAEWSRLEAEGAAAQARVVELEAKQRSSAAAAERRVASLEIALSTAASREAEVAASASTQRDVLRAELVLVSGELEKARGGAGASAAVLEREAQSARAALQTTEAAAAAAAAEAHSCRLTSNAEIGQLRKQVGARNAAMTKTRTLHEIELADHARLKREHENTVTALDAEAKKNTELLRSLIVSILRCYTACTGLLSFSLSLSLSLSHSHRNMRALLFADYRSSAT